MNWHRWNPDLAGNVRTLLLVALLLVLLCLAFVVLPSQSQNVNAGFGPGWECAAQPKGGPICIRKVGPSS